MSPVSHAVSLRRYQRDNAQPFASVPLFPDVSRVLLFSFLLLFSSPIWKTRPEGDDETVTSVIMPDAEWEWRKYAAPFAAYGITILDLV